MNINELILMNQNGKLMGSFSKEDIPIELYHHKDCPAISKTGLDRINKYPAYYKHFLTETKEETPALKFGSAVHCAILEPNLFDELYIDDSFLTKLGSRATKAYKEALKKFQFENPNKIILSSADMENITGMKNEIYNHPIAKNCFKDGTSEQTFFWQEMDHTCKIRTDFIRKDNYVIDYKTTTNINEVEKSIATYRYYVTDAMHKIGLKAVTSQDYKVLFIFQEKQKPYGIRIVELDQDAKIHGEKIFYRDLEQYIYCMKKNVWANYQVNNKYCIEKVSLPKWIYFKEENQ